MTSFESTISCPPCPTSSSSGSITGAAVAVGSGASTSATSSRPRYQTRLSRLTSQQTIDQTNKLLQASAQATAANPPANGSGNGSNGLGMLTPKRKCSFSSFSECRLLEEDGENHHTFLFSIEAPSPPPTPQLRSELFFLAKLLKYLCCFY